MSSIEVEYIAATEAVKEGMQLKSLLNELGHIENHVELCYDIPSAIFLSKNPIFHDRIKHIDV